DLGLYDKAIVEYMAAYQARNHPALLYDLGKAHRLAGHAKEAYRFYRTYLQRSPDAVNRAEVERALVELSQTIEREEHTRNQPVPEPPRLPLSEPTPEVATVPAPAIAPVRARTSAPVSRVVQTAPEARPGSAKRIAGYSIGALGIGSAALGITFGALA